MIQLMPLRVTHCATPSELLCKLQRATHETGEAQPCKVPGCSLKDAQALTLRH